MSDVTAFFEDRIIAMGGRGEVLRLVEERYAAADHAAVRVYEDESGRVVDLDYWDAAASAAAGPPEPPRGRGRPKLGVVAREVTLLPRQWDWLARRPGGASAVLRRLVDQAIKAEPRPEERRDAAYRFMSDHCGDRPGYEEALRALYRGERDRLEALIAAWPEDIRAYILRLLD
jgi:hypothetical protein